MNPFPGLRPFRPDEQHLFFGRQSQTNVLFDRISESRLLAVVGPSGSGKSSLVKAGLLPALAGDFVACWKTVIMRPGAKPLSHLAQELGSAELFGNGDPDASFFLESTLKRGRLGLVRVVQEALEAGTLKSHDRLLIVVDQFEELFRFLETSHSEYASEATLFVSLLLHACAHEDLPVYCLMTMRSDFFGHCARFRGLPEAVGKGLYLIPRLTREERRQCIIGPIGVAQGRLERALENRLLNEGDDVPDSLPVLQHLLMRMWSQSTDADLNLEVFESVGGFDQALNLHLEELFEQCTEGEKELSRLVFSRLSRALDLDNSERQLCTYGELWALCQVETNSTDKELACVLDHYRQAGCSFLMPGPEVKLAPNVTVDISHESLIRLWDRLGEWSREERREAKFLLRLNQDAAEWKAGDHELLGEPRLSKAEAWREEKTRTIPWAARYLGPEEADEQLQLIWSYIEESRKEQVEAATRREKQSLELKEAQSKLSDAREEIEVLRATLESYPKEIQQLLQTGQPERARKRLLDFAHDFGDSTLLRNALRSDEKPATILELTERVSNATVPGLAVETEELEIVLSADGLEKRYRKGTQFQLEGVTFEVRLGEILGVVGPNGAGKSTLLKILAGELALDSGCCHYPCFDPAEGTTNWATIRASIAYVPQFLPSWQGRLIDILNRTASLHGFPTARVDDEVNYILQRLDLERFRTSKYKHLSGGYRVRFALARALLTRARLLILDEPLGPLDVVAQARFLADIQDLARSARSPRAVIMTSQHLVETEAVSDKVLFLSNGRVSYWGTPDKIGTSRTENIFELSSEWTADDIRVALRQLKAKCLADSPGVTKVQVPRSVSSEELLNSLLQARVPVHYFRDTSRSTKALFREELVE